MSSATRVIQDEGAHNRQAAKDEGGKSATAVSNRRIVYRVANAAYSLDVLEE